MTTVARKALLGTLSLIGAGGVGLGLALDRTVKARDLIGHAPKYPWSHNGHFDALDAASMRRGYEVYRQVCAACHSLQYIAYRHLVNISHSEEEMKVIAAETMVEDGPNDEGNMFMRPGKLADYHTGPYKNPEQARAANSGAFPPDLTLIVKARHGNEDYIFQLLTGYMDPPAGIKVGEDLHFNPYFPGGQIAMARVLYNELIEYSDGTPATAHQMAKDVVTFLRYTAEPWHDERKRMFIKGLMINVIFGCVLFWFRRHKWSVLVSKQFTFIPKKK